MVDTVDRKTITKTVEETAGCKIIKKTVEVRLDEIETKICRKYNELWMINKRKNTQKKKKKEKEKINKINNK